MTMKVRVSRDIVFLILAVFVPNAVVALMTVADANNINDTSTDKPNQDQEDREIDRMIHDVLQSSEQTLQAYEQYTSATPIEPNPTESVDHLQKLFTQLDQLETTHEQLINDINTQQMKELQHHLENLLLSVVDNHNASVTKSHSPKETAVTVTELERRLAPENVLSESESILTEWIRSIIKQEINELDVTPFISSLPSKQSSTVSTDTSKTCISVETAAEEVYVGLMRYLYDGIGLMDYTHSIVHQYTSPTFVMTNEDQSSTTSTLGTVWWNRYIPQDWENLLPLGWQSWTVWSFIIPDHIYHSLGEWWGKKGIGSGPVCAPPEAILQASTLPGHCWPVSIIPKPAIVTIRLQPSIVVTSISIDHMSKLFFSQFKQQLSSAPKRMKVFGYAPCSSVGHSSENNCHGLGFDIMSKTFLAELTYNLDGESSVQTFPIGHTNHDDSVRMANSVEGSCSATASSDSCMHRNSGETAAVTVEILDNWGHEYYTCLYRIRVHGEPMQ